MSKTIRFSITDGMLDHDYVHDAEIVGFDWNKSKGNVTLNLITEDKHLFAIEFRDVHALSIADFTKQNVIAEIQVKTKVNLRDEIDDAFHILPDIRGRLEKKIENGEYFFVEIIPSVGIHLMCVCNKIEMLEESPN